VKTNIWGRLSFIVVIFILALSVALPNRDGAVFGVPVPSFFPNVDLSLGLDLQGGTQLRYALDLSKVPADRTQSVISGVQEVIRRRVDNLGVAEPVIQMADVGEQKHLIVELPGVKT
jgi:preprotein translocase subunit SecD